MSKIIDLSSVSIDDARPSSHRTTSSRHDHKLDGLIGGAEAESFQLTEDGFFGNSGIMPVRCIFIATGAYQEVVRRSHNINVTDEDIDDLTELYHDQGVTPGKLDMIGVSSIANRVIRPSVDIDKTIEIANGWAEPRLSFILEFRRFLPGGGHISYCYTGFTDYVGAHEDGSIDPSMRMHVTSSVVARTDTGSGRTMITKDQNILVKEHFYAEDTVAGIDRRRRQEGKVEYVMDPASSVIYDYSRNNFQDRDRFGRPVQPGNLKIGSKAKLVHRGYNNPSFYLTKLANTKEAHRQQEHLYEDPIYGDEEANYNSRVVSGLSLPRIKDDPLAALFRDDGFEESATLIWEDLITTFPTLDDTDHSITEVHFPDQMMRGSHFTLEKRLRDAVRDGLDADHWRGATPETMFATSLAHQLPNLMVSEMIESIRFTVTNETIQDFDSPYTWIFGDHRRDRYANRNAVNWFATLTARGEQQRLEAFKRKVEGIILDPMTMNGEIPVDLMVDCDVRGDLTILVRLDGRSEQRFVIPTYVDAMTSPIITCDLDRFDNFSEGVNRLVGTALESI